MTPDPLREKVNALLAKWQARVDAASEEHGDGYTVDIEDCIEELAACLRDGETCGVRGKPSESDDVLTCDLAVGHEGYHHSGRWRWLGYHVGDGETPHD